MEGRFAGRDQVRALGSVLWSCLQAVAWQRVFSLLIVILCDGVASNPKKPKVNQRSLR